MGLLPKCMRAAVNACAAHAELPHACSARLLSWRTHACTCAQVALANDGRIFVADGYCNARVLEFDAAGKYRAVYVLPPGKGPMRIPHSVMLQARLPAPSPVLAASLHACALAAASILRRILLKALLYFMLPIRGVQSGGVLAWFPSGTTKP